jgi:hypothetical protein
MKYRTRTYYTDVQKALMWERWKQGWTRTRSLITPMICMLRTRALNERVSETSDRSVPFPASNP